MISITESLVVSSAPQSQVSQWDKDNQDDNHLLTGASESSLFLNCHSDQQVTRLSTSLSDVLYVSRQ